MKTLLLAASIVALSTAAHAGMSCNLTDQRGNVLQYSFAHGGHGYTNEIVVKRNGTVISNGGPMWARSFNRAQRTMTLEQAGWSIVYEAKPNDSDTSQAALFHNANRVAAGVCDADYSVDAPQPAPTIEASAPAPAYNSPTPAPASGDDVPFIQIPGTGMMVMAIVGGHSLPMVVDTGAAMSSIPTALADRLIAEGHAQEAASGDMVMADGSSHYERTVIVDTLSLGSHSRSQVRVSVSDGEALLGLPVLNAIGRFTIDAQHGVVSFT
jgi:hypothetical protein